MKAYYVELDNLGWQGPVDEGMWKSIDAIVAEGDTLEELLHDATVFLTDQDGGNAGERTLDILSSDEREYIKERFRAKMLEQAQ